MEINQLTNFSNLPETSGRICLLLCLTAVVVACTGGGYQAPIADRSQTLEQAAVVIVTRSDDRPSRYIGAGNNAVEQSSSRQTDSAAPPATGMHRVTAGETLYSIAFQYNLDFRILALANNLNPPYRIVEDQELSLDLNQAIAPVNTAGSTTLISAVGTVVDNNSIARSQAANNSVRGVLRQPIGGNPTQTPAPAQTSIPTPTTPTPAQTPAQIAISSEPNWQWPVQGRILKNFQESTGSGRGLDIGAEAGQSVFAAANGDVVYAGSGIQGSGNLIIIRHSDRFLSAYAHNRNLLVSEGDQINGGAEIAEIGAREDGTAMLHFEIRMDGSPVDPLQYLPSR